QNKPQWNNRGNNQGFRQNRGPLTQTPGLLKKFASVQQKQNRGNQDRTTCAWCQFNNHSLSTCYKFGLDVEKMTGLKLIKPNGQYLTGSRGKPQGQRNQRFRGNAVYNK
ncbi:MAG: hypothetical protein MJA29_05555, partial [Candidatus Omnitrophica bacterium]|nr:hypothetical protein [Candidatus Omnitrophota bacterium]